MNLFAIAGIQMYVSAVTSNVPAMEQRLATLLAIYPWVQMVVFSELAAHGPLTAHAEPMPGPTEDAFCAMARKHNIWLLPGSMYEKRDGNIYNTTPVINPQGEVIQRYRKMFPFLPYEEGVTAGDSFCLFDIPDVGRFGLSICYDMWFPETTRTLVTMGAEVILHPSLTPSIDRDVELSIIRATAVTNQCYVFEINGIGAGGIGRSIVVGPEGTVLHQANNGDEMFPLEIDLERVQVSRERGIMRLGQVLKSFRDSTVDFSQTYAAERQSDYLESLGPLLKPHRAAPMKPIPTAPSATAPTPTAPPTTAASSLTAPPTTAPNTPDATLNSTKTTARKITEEPI